MNGETLARAAIALVGVRYSFRGRDPATGLDCIGVLACALERCGIEAALPSQYSLRAARFPDAELIAGSCGLTVACGAMAEGDIMLVRPGVGQRHLMIAVDRTRAVHAHAGLGRVVIGPVRRD